MDLGSFSPHELDVDASLISSSTWVIGYVNIVSADIEQWGFTFRTCLGMGGYFPSNLQRDDGIRYECQITECIWTNMAAHTQ